ncbi:SRPBCC family protein [Lewinella sp. IMCC34183]|uniref:SRPBCC family protein n=1 Tax=Lewinella sp. IMCC34183 TaxID=2248762 RepID=UPI000E24526C|nr:SRPBCC family protein [Lewinella sp. IMCC34183]
MPLALPADALARRAVAILTTLPVAGALTAWGIYGLGSYGLALFALTPLLIGFLAAVVNGYGRTATRVEATVTAFLALGLFTAGLVLFAVEGLICIAMAAPLAVLFTWLGAVAGHAAADRHRGGSLLTVGVLLVAIPLLSSAERGSPPPAEPVTTRVVVAAPPERVWREVVAFSPLPEPDEWLFRLGIAYPIDATIAGTGVGAVRHCNFNTGSFVEPVTVWDPPHRLAFDVRQQPVPLREISFWDVDAPHLHDFFVSRRGEFRLTAREDGTTLLEGTTWYYHDLRPAFYWRWWSNAIVHAIHARVLNHVRSEAEKSPAPASAPKHGPRDSGFSQ